MDAFLPSSVLKWSSQYSYRSYNMAALLNGREFFPDYGDNCSSAVFRYFGDLRRHAVVYDSQLNQLRHRTHREGKCETIAPHYDDFVILYFEHAISIKEVILYEVYNPGCLTSISGALIDKPALIETAVWTELWDRNMAAYIIASDEMGSAMLPRSLKTDCFVDMSLDSNKRVINCLCLEFNSENINYYAEIDCIEIKGTANVDDCSDTSIDAPGMLNLPSELLFQIFSSCSLMDLDCLSSTCIRLYDLANDCSLYRSLDFRPLWKTLTDRQLEKLAQKCKIHKWDPKSISFEWCSKISGEAIETLLKSCPNLKFLNLANTAHSALASLNFGSVSKFCPNLETLILRFNHDEKVLASGKKLAPLKSLRIFSLESGFIETAQIPSFRDWICSNKCLTFLSLDALQPRFRPEQTNFLLDMLSRNCPNLESLNICRQSIDNQSFIHMSTMTCLKSLDVGWSFRPEIGPLEFNSAICQMLNSKRGHFTTLIFTACRGFNLDSLSCIATTQPNLQCLDILGVSSLLQGYTTLENVFKKCKDLRYVDLSYVKGISDREVAVLAALYTKVLIKRAHTCKYDEDFYQNLLRDPKYGLTETHQSY
ncbi:F-box/LRR-repeat protein 4-like isoform X2 [Convolutriloba macropyga]|uniref:F-box/LRR-repeat protein 4-like isoform X2 n=1 Tax=Convolutriloba macropyga TaxID=536237 RepID=UPI003F522197